MSKIIGIICLGGVGILYSIVLILTYLLGLVYLFVSEIIGTKKFMDKFQRLNKLIYDEFKNMMITFKSLFDID